MSNFSSSKPAQLISGAGNFNKAIGTELDFGNDRGLVGVVSIMGVQSSGKSTLMNKCFSTDFSEMNQEMGMSQTTKGISMSKLSFPDGGHKVLLLDCEGSDGVEREEEGSSVFEKQVTLFALASSDVVMINMKCDSVNLHNGAGMPLIQIVFQVMIRKFNTPRRVTLMFVLRDKNEVPLEKLKSQLKSQLAGVWKKVCADLIAPKPALEDFFKVQVVALPHYRYAEEAFMAEVGVLRERVFEVVENGKLSQAANFISFTQKNWIDIQEDKVLNLQVNKNSVDEEFFIQTKDEILQRFSKNQGWIKMKNDVRGSVAEGFGEFVTSLIESHVSEFDEETQSFSEKLRDDFRCQLTKGLLEVVQDTYHFFLKTKKDSYLGKFEKEVKEKVEALDKNISAEEYTNGFFDSLKEARVKQAEEWIEAYESFEDVKSSIKHQVDCAYKAIEEREREIIERQTAEAEEAAKREAREAQREAERVRREAQDRPLNLSTGNPTADFILAPIVAVLGLKKLIRSSKEAEDKARREVQEARDETERLRQEAELFKSPFGVKALTGFAKFFKTGSNVEDVEASRMLEGFTSLRVDEEDMEEDVPESWAENLGSQEVDEDDEVDEEDESDMMTVAE